jgi:hypothetical protein
MGAEEISPLPAQRIDMIVTDPASGEKRRRTDYAGTVWFGGQPEFIGGYPRPGVDTEIRTAFWLPDSHKYESGAGGDALVQASAAVQAAMATSYGGYFLIREVDAALGEDPQNSGALLVFVTVIAFATLPLGVTYRVTVICGPEALRPPAA